jgi:adenylate cyclase
MTQEGFKRKLTAILSADVEGYSRLMGEDEDETIRTLTTYRELMSTIIQKHRGRVVDSPGDNLLAEFGSVVDTVRCAVEIQEELRVRNVELPENRMMEFRIGINLGDVVEEGERIYGDGVNIAARVEGLAEGGGICISGAVYDSVKNKLSLNYESLGEHTVKNIKEPIRVYRMRVGPDAAAPGVGKEKRHGVQRWQRTALAAVIVLIVGAVASWNFYFRLPSVDPASVEKMAFPLPDIPSIAVLPFVNMSDDPKQEYFSDGITENIITDLSKISAFFVISRSSTYAYKGKPVKIKQVAEELGVRYVLEGSVQKGSDKVRINAQLVDAITGHHLWAERYDRDLKDIFAVQDEITQKIVRTLRVEVTEVELERVRRIPTENLNAYESFYRGLEYYRRSSKSSNTQARRMFEKAIELDPRFSVAYVFLGHTYRRDWLYRWSQDPQTMERAFELAQKAIELNDSSIYAYELLGYIYLLKDRQHEQAIAMAEKVIALDPNYAGGYGLLAEILSFAGRPEEVIGLMEKAMRLNPRYPAIYLFWLGNAHYQMGWYDEAIAVLKSAVIRRPNHMPTHLFLTASYVELGREEEARAEVAEILRISPDYRSGSKSLAPWKDQAVPKRIRAALRKAGLK